MSKSKRIMQLSNLIEAVSTGLITIASVRSECKLHEYYTERVEITPDKFVESIRSLNETIFKDIVDMYFYFSDDKTVIVKCDMKNAYMNECLYAECVIKEGVSVEQVEKKLRQSIFDKVA